MFSPTLPLPSPTAHHTDRPYLCLGLEGSANKFGAGIILHTLAKSQEGRDVETVKVLSNIRHTYVTPPGQGFLPSDTAKHHKEWALTIIRQAVDKAGVKLKDLDCIAYTKGQSLHFSIWHSNRLLMRLSRRPWHGRTSSERCFGGSHTIHAVRQATDWSQSLCWT